MAVSPSRAAASWSATPSVPGRAIHPSPATYQVAPPPPKDYITLDVVQGLGDIFWVYQKVAPHFKTINLNICVVVLEIVGEVIRVICSKRDSAGGTAAEKSE